MGRPVGRIVPNRPRSLGSETRRRIVHVPASHRARLLDGRHLAFPADLALVALGSCQRCPKGCEVALLKVCLPEHRTALEKR